MSTNFRKDQGRPSDLGGPAAEPVVLRQIFPGFDDVPFHASQIFWVVVPDLGVEAGEHQIAAVIQEELHAAVFLRGKRVFAGVA